MGNNCYSNRPEESRSKDIIEKVNQFIKSNNFYYLPALQIYNYGQEALKIQSDTDLEAFLDRVIEQKEILKLQKVTFKKVMKLMNFAVRIKSIQDEDIPIILVEMIFLYLADPDRIEIQNEKIKIIKLLINTEKTKIDKKDTKFKIDVKKFLNNIRLFINIVYMLLFSYILLIVFLPSGQLGLEVYFENQTKHKLGMDDTLKWVYKIIETITNERIEKHSIVETCIRFIEEPIIESIIFLFIFIYSYNK